ncbi:MAG: HAMP domain-containing sensor histidine kinase, partial [Chloroflexota bacterium]
VEELTFDIGRILHANTGTLLMAQQTLDGVAEALGQRAIKELIAAPLEERDEQLIKQAALLANTIDKLAQATEPERRCQALSDAKWNALTDKIAPLRQARDLIPGVEMRAPALRSTAHQITMLCQDMTPGVLSRELVRDVLRAAAQLENSACLVDVLMTRTAIIQMDSTLRSLRDFITADIRVYEPKKQLSVKQLTDQAITQIVEFARSSRVEIVRRDRDFDTHVEGIERDLVRALSNLLHNAIKYSWRRDRAKAPWVTVRTYAREGIVCIEFENWGVPIAQEEIEQGLIFQLGYRGKWSKDRGRLGTGIGLTDAKRTAQTHYGDLRVASRPSNPGWIQPDDPTFYNQPFVTTVTFCIPEAIRR